jgi:sulfonate transport system ATP-binding protein
MNAELREPGSRRERDAGRRGLAPGGRAVHLQGLRKAFGPRVVLDGIDLDIRRGEFVVLLGASGTGKTTLLRILAGLDEADDGVVLVPTVRTTVYQEPRLVPSMRVLANVTIGQHGGPHTRKAGLNALTEVRLTDHAHAWPGTLSGGEAQRVALARALVREPELLLLDEPFAALDALTRLQMQDLVGELFMRHRPAVLLVTHDVDEAIRLADRILVLREGSFVVDLRIEASGARDPSDPRFAEYRSRLLRALGVGHD